jgi:O-succinylhomoserine sulfhydrylase
MTDQPRTYRQETALVRGGQERSPFRETSEALYLNSGYVFDNAAQAEAAFKGENDNFIYSRYGNPTVKMFEDRLAMLEGAEACYATATGMAAVFSSLACQVNDEWEAALSQPTKAVFMESPSNPMLDLVDIAAVSEMAHAAGARVVIDNVFATPLYQRPFELGADIVVYSATKHIDGQGRCLGGAVLSTAEFMTEKFMPFYRHTGPSLSPFNAWVMVKALETLSVRVKAQSESSLELARFLQEQPKVTQVCHPGLDSHPQAELARRQMSGFGNLVTFDVAGDKAAAFRLADELSIIDISNNLGDTKSLVCHPATTTHSRLSEADRAQLGITQGVLRISVGLEHIDDLKEDLLRALAVA